MNLLIALATLALPLHGTAADGPLTAQAPMVVPGGAGHFDFMNIDPVNHLVFACHPEKSSLTVVNLSSREIKDVPLTTSCNGMDSDPVNKKVFAAGPGKTLVKFDAVNWTKEASLDLDGPGDSVVYDPNKNVVYVDNDDGTNLWVVDPATMKIVATVTIKEAPEVMVLDSGRNKIFQNIKTTNSLQVIDTESRKVVAEWPLGELTSPHGLAEDKSMGKLFSVGKNGKLVILDAESGKILSTIDVAKNSDQIAYDPELKRLYVPGSGKIDIVQITADGASVTGSVPMPNGCHSVTLDPQTHDVWIAYSDGKDSYVMKYSAKG